MSKIKVMSDLLANKIAAGEVIEKIASVVKELVENSIDAHANSITINLLDGGIKSLRVIDNGIGMDSIDAENAFLRHATSKVYKEDDLYFIDTLGFRGEALPSIASVSEIKMSTFDGNESTYIHIKGGDILEKSKCGEKKGTDIEVTNIFYNTPARLKFLKSEATELSNITSFVERLALSNPNISFMLTNNEKIVVKTSGSNDLKKVVYEIFGTEVTNNLLEFKNMSDDFEIKGFICKPHLLKSRNNFMFTFLNKRTFKNSEIINSINDAFYTYKPVDKYPIIFLFIDADPTIIDVNIHPTKQDVKISKINELKDLIYNTLKNTLYNNLLIIKPLEDKENLIEDEIKDEKKVEDDLPFDNTLKKNTQVFMDFGKEEVIKNEEIKSLVLYPVGLSHGTYIIAENEDGMYLIDQHAAYERINYERYMKKLREKEVGKISTLIPITLEYDAGSYLKLMEKKDIIQSLNIDIEEFGINTLIVKSHPTWLKEGYEEESIRKIFDLIINLDKKFDRIKFEEKIAITLACKMSIKANMHISNTEIEYILNELVKCDNPYNCPHGRPTIIKFTIYDLEKMFKRVMD